MTVTRIVCINWGGTSTDARSIRLRSARAVAAATAIGAITLALIGVAPAQADEALNSLDEISYEAIERDAPTFDLTAGQNGQFEPSVVGDVQATTGPTTNVYIERFAGADRFGTAAALSRIWAPSPAVAYVVNGMNFPTH